MKSMELLNHWIEDKVSRGVVPVISHRNGDMDTIASACALSQSLGDKARAMGIHVSRLAREVIDELKFEFTRIDTDRIALPRTTSGLIIVDAAGPDQIGMNLPENTPICIIDHHAHTSDHWNITRNDLHINMPVCSTTQIIYDYIKEYHPGTLDDSMRKLLLTGLITDTGHYRHADSVALKSASEILGDQIKHGDVLDLLRTTGIGRSVRIATLRSLSNVNVESAGNFVVAVTSCSTHEGTVAGSLIHAGADASIVSNSKVPGIRLTTRASHRAIENGLDMGSILSSLAEKLGGEGGGHAGAAGWTTNIDKVEALSSILSRISAVR